MSPRALAAIVAALVPACFAAHDAAVPCDGAACVGRDADGDAVDVDGSPAADGARPDVFAVRDVLFLTGPGADRLAGVTTSGGFGPIVAGHVGGGVGAFGKTSVATDQGPGDLEGVVATINSTPLSYLPSLPLPSPSSDGTSAVRATRIAVDSSLQLIVAIGTSRVNEPVVFDADASPTTCPGTWIAAWRLTDGALAWAHCYPAGITFSRVRIHPSTHQIVIVGSWQGMFNGLAADGIDGFAASVGVDGQPLDSFVVSGASDDGIDDLAPYGDGWLVAGHDVRPAQMAQAMVWLLDASLDEPGTAVRLEIGATAQDAVTALVAEPSGSRFWMAVALGAPTTIAGMAVATPAALVAFDATPTSLTPSKVLAVDASTVHVNALAASEGGIFVVGSATGPLTIGGVDAPGSLGAEQPFWGHIDPVDGVVDPLEQLQLGGGEGRLLDVAAHPDGIYAVGQARGNVEIAGMRSSFITDEGILLRIANEVAP